MSRTDTHTHKHTRTLTYIPESIINCINNTNWPAILPYVHSCFNARNEITSIKFVRRLLFESVNKSLGKPESYWNTGQLQKVWRCKLICQQSAYPSDFLLCRRPEQFRQEQAVEQLSEMNTVKRGTQAANVFTQMTTKTRFFMLRKKLRITTKSKPEKI